MEDPHALPLEKLCALCEDMYIKYNPAATTPDTHMEEKLAEYRVKSEKDQQFLKQVFYGMTRYKKLLHVLIQGFYYANSDINLFTLFAYFTILRIKDLGFGPYRQLILSQDGQKMLVMLHFIFNEENLNKYCRDEWMKLYDAEYVDELISKLLSYLPHLDDMIKSLEHKVYLSKKAEEEEAQTFEAGGGTVTIPSPFKLSESKPPLAEPPYVHPSDANPLKAQPAPPRRPTGYLNKQQRDYKAIQEENRRKQQELYSDPKVQPFVLATDERPTNIEKVKEQVDKEWQEAYPFTTEEKPKPIPEPPQANVRLNAAAILREDAVYKKKQEEEALKIKAYEQDLRDDSEHHRWKLMMEEKDEQERLAVIEHRREVWEAEAEQARIQREFRDSEKVRKMRQEGERIKRQLDQEKAAVEMANRERRDIIVEARAGVKVAVEKLEDAKVARARELMREKEDNARRVTEEKALEMVRKQELIRQLKAIEAVPVSRVDKYDPTTTQGQGLLEEMSLAELRERVEVMKRRQKQEEMDKRVDIIQKRQKKEELLVAKAANIARIRDMANAQAALRREQVKEKEHTEKAVAKRKNEDEMLVLHERLQRKHEAMKAEQLRLAAEEKRIKFEQAKAAASAGAVEEKKFKEIRRGQERELKVKQVVSKAAEIKYEKGKERTRGIRATNLKTEQRGKRDFIKEFDEKLRLLHMEKEQLLDDDLEHKRTLVRQEQQRYETMKANGLMVSAQTLAPPTTLDRSARVAAQLARQQEMQQME